jgi:hypothetical protein
MDLEKLIHGWMNTVEFCNCSKQPSEKKSLNKLYQCFSLLPPRNSFKFAFLKMTQLTAQ